MISFKLALQGLKREKIRTVAAVAGVAAAVTLLGWHLALANTVSAQAADSVLSATAPYSAWIVGPSGGSPAEQPEKGRAVSAATTGFRRAVRRAPGPVPDEILRAVSGAGCVKSTLRLNIIPAAIDFRPGGRIVQGPPMMTLTAVIPPSGTSPFASDTLLSGNWPDASAAENEAAVADSVFLSRGLTPPSPGTDLTIITGEGAVVFKITGIFSHNPMNTVFPTIYASQAAFDQLARATRFRSSGGANMLLIETKQMRAPEEIESILDSMPEHAGKCTFTTRRAVESRYRSDTARDIMRQLPMSLSLAFITAICLMTAVLTAGIAEQRRRIAMLRCAGMTRAGTMRLMMCESGITAAAGWAAGFPAAIALLQIFLLSEQNQQLPAVVHPGWQTALWTFAATCAVWLAASAAPVIKVSKIAPLEAVDADSESASACKISWRKTAAGIALMSIIVLVAIYPSHSADMMKLIMAAAGIPAFFIGAALCIHPVLRLTEILFCPIAARIVGLDSRLISGRISRNPGNAAGTIMALSLGLCSFIAIHIWGSTLMSSYVPSPEWPDVIVSALPGGLSEQQTAEAANGTGLESPVLPIECTQFPFDESTVETIEKRGGTHSGVVLVFGTDAVSAFAGEKPLAAFRFTRGTTAESAVRDITEGERPGGTPACIVPEMFLRLTGLNVGERFSIAGREIVIAGAVELNWHLVTSRAMVRTLFGRLDRTSPAQRPAQTSQTDRRTLGMIFTGINFARELSGNTERTNFLWANLTPEYRSLHPLQASVRADANLRSRMATDSGSVIRVHHRDEISEGTIAHGNDILGTMARIPFWSLIVTSMGIAVLLTASAQASRKETAIMRAIGMTRGQVAAMFAGEAALITVVMLIMSCIGGLLIGWSFTACTRMTLNSGLPVTLVIPWLTIAKGAAMATATCALMAAYPIYKISRSE